jgi:hypothetical protein
LQYCEELLCKLHCPGSRIILTNRDIRTN